MWIRRHTRPSKKTHLSKDSLIEIIHGYFLSQMPDHPNNADIRHVSEHHTDVFDAFHSLQLILGCDKVPSLTHSYKLIEAHLQSSLQTDISIDQHTPPLSIDQALVCKTLITTVMLQIIGANGIARYQHLEKKGFVDKKSREDFGDDWGTIVAQMTPFRRDAKPMSLLRGLEFGKYEWNVIFKAVDDMRKGKAPRPIHPDSERAITLLWDLLFPKCPLSSDVSFEDRLVYLQRHEKFSTKTREGERDSKWKKHIKNLYTSRSVFARSLFDCLSAAKSPILKDLVDVGRSKNVFAVYKQNCKVLRHGDDNRPIGDLVAIAGLAPNMLEHMERHVRDFLIVGSPGLEGFPFTSSKNAAALQEIWVDIVKPTYTLLSQHAKPELLVLDEEGYIHARREMEEDVE